MPSKLPSKRELTAPCGIDCFNCPVYEGLITDVMSQRLAAQLGIEPDTVPCRGCREQQGCRLSWTSCATLDCATERGVEFCYECAGFPCAMLQPVAAAAPPYPHNIKLYNLCRIKAVGVERWAEEEAAAIRRRYFEGKFVVGQGPVLEEV